MTKVSASSLTAADIMQKDVVVIDRHETLQDAMTLLTENHITGLPVVDSKSRCIGVVSASDILNYEQEHSDFTAEANSDMARHYDPDTGRWESVRVGAYALEEFAELPVENVMAVDVVSVLRETPLCEVAQLMVKQKIHRVLVLDEDQLLFGIITSSDFVRLFAEENSG